MTEELEDFDLVESTPDYQIWLFGYDVDHNLTNFDFNVDSFADHREAIKCAKYFTNKDIILANVQNIPAEVKYISVEVETVISTEDLEENIDTIYAEEVNLYEN